MCSVKTRRIVVVPTNCEREWFAESLNRFGSVDFVVDEAKLSLKEEAREDIASAVASADLVVYRRMRAKRLYPTDAPSLCVEWTPLRHSCTWGHYFADPKGFFHEGELAVAFRRLTTAERDGYFSAGERIRDFYLNTVHGETVSVIEEFLARRRHHHLLAVIVLQVPEDDTVVFGSRFSGDPHQVVIAAAKTIIGDRADIVVKPHPAHPALTTAGIQASEGTIVVDHYCPILALLKMADIVVTINSSCAVESLILGTPVVALGSCPAAELGMVWEPESFLSSGSLIRHTAEWQRNGLSFIGFIAEAYGSWFPSTRRLIEGVERLIRSRSL